MISKCIALLTQALTIADDNGYLPLHTLSANESSTIEAMLMMSDKYPACIATTRYLR
jgi:hypothetical protein